MEMHPGVAYISSLLWLPREMVDVRQTKAVLTFTPISTHGRPKTILAWRETPTHIAVPLYYWGDIYSPDFRRKFVDARVPLKDIRPTQWEEVGVFSKIKLDALRNDTIQSQAYRLLMKSESGILVLSCGSGKTVIALHTAAQFKHPFLVVVYSSGLAQQWIGEINRHLTTSLGKPPTVGLVGEGKNEWTKPIVVGSINTISDHYKDLPEEIRNRFFAVIYDEGDILGAAEFGKAAAMFPGRRWVLSATPKRADGLEEMYYLHVGKPIMTYLRQELKPAFFFYKTSTVIGEEDPYYRANVAPNGVVDIASLYSYLGSNLSRCQEIAALIQEGIKAGRKILVLSRGLAVLRTLKRYLPKAAFIHGGVCGEDRERMVRGCDVILSQMRLGEKALNKPNLDMIILCHPVKRKETLQQIMGRELRALPDKSQPVFVIIEDNVGPCIGMCRKLKKMITSWPVEEGGPYGWGSIVMKDKHREDTPRPKASRASGQVTEAVGTRQWGKKEGKEYE